MLTNAGLNCGIWTAGAGRGNQVESSGGLEVQQAGIITGFIALMIALVSSGCSLIGSLWPQAGDEEIDEECDIVGVRRYDYAGPEGTEGAGICRPQIEECQVAGERTIFQVIQEGVVPDTEIPGDGIDQNCNGFDDECVVGETRESYSGPDGIQGVGICVPQIEECRDTPGGAVYQIIQDEVLPEPEICGDGLDNDCMGESPAEEWDRTFGGLNGDTAHSVRQTSDGGFILAGHTGTWPDYDAWLIRVCVE